MVFFVLVDGDPDVVVRAELVLREVCNSYTVVSPHAWMVAVPMRHTDLRDHVSTEAPGVRLLILSLSGVWATYGSQGLTRWLQEREWDNSFKGRRKTNNVGIEQMRGETVRDATAAIDAILLWLVGLSIGASIGGILGAALGGVVAGAVAIARFWRRKRGER